MIPQSCSPVTVSAGAKLVQEISFFSCEKVIADMRCLHFMKKIKQ